MPGGPRVGLRRLPEYEVWKSMRQRCLNVRNRDYPDYGGRGISVSAEWSDFLVFYQDMGPRPDGYLLDRRNNDEGYSKANCRWVTALESVKNRRPITHCKRKGHALTPENTKLHANGFRQCLTCWRAYHRDWMRQKHGHVPKVTK
jgi:hypothetical protein